uniref:WLM domain-containing protein n=1 Tax=viral metagenome TaxID=1070528 RepID=A0A6C0AZ62_9ZZZZ
MLNGLWKSDILVYVIIGFVLLICLKIYSESELFSLKCVISTIDGNKYCVRDRTKITEAADLLATVTGKCKQLVDYVGKKYPDNPDVTRLVKGFNPTKISETLPTSELTAYSENKGEKIAFCLNKTKNSSTLIDINTLTFVSIHELSHIMTTSIGHKQDFWQHFKFLLENAKEANIYIPVDYKSKPQGYCGMTITDNPYYDL